MTAVKLRNHKRRRIRYKNIHRTEKLKQKAFKRWGSFPIPPEWNSERKPIPTPMKVIEDGDLYAWSLSDVGYYCPTCGKKLYMECKKCSSCGQVVYYRAD